MNRWFSLPGAYNRFRQYRKPEDTCSPAIFFSLLIAFLVQKRNIVYFLLDFNNGNMHCRNSYAYKQIKIFFRWENTL
jgi:hypothetical protein